MDWQAMLKKQWQISTDRFLQAIADVTPEEAVARPQDLTPIVWQVGHVAYYDAILLRRAGLEADIPAAYEQLFPIGTDGRGNLPSLDAVREFFRQGSERVAALIDDPEALVRPTQGTPNYATLAEGVLYVIGHRGYHRGKIMTLRALLGKPRLA